MKDSQPHIDYDLIGRFLAGEMDQSERADFEKRVNASAELKRELELLSEVWKVTAEPELEVDVDRAWNRVSFQTAEEDFSEEAAGARSGFRIWSLAAAITVLIGVSAAFWFLRSDPMMSIETQMELAEVTLSDGSIVSLDGASKLEYPESFKGQVREVWLSGVGYFEVEKDAEHPFIVHTDHGDVTVLGTAFEVNTRTVEQVQVEVAEGRVAVKSSEGNLSAEVGAGESCLLDVAKKVIEVEESIEPDAFYWKDKIIRFKRSELGKVIEVLDRLLNLKVELEDPSLGACQLTATFKEESPESIIEIIAATLNLEYVKTDQGYVLSGEGC